MSDERKSSILGHLQELRSRLIKSVIAVLITTGISFVFADEIFGILKRPAGGIELVFIEMTEMLGTYMKVCLLSGIALAMPFLLFQLIMFVAPALTSKEKKMVYIVTPWIALMFAAGVAFGYFILIPPAVQFLTTFGAEIATPTIKIGNYISIATRLLLSIGLIFEIPVITTLLARLGVITSQWLASKRKPFIIVAFILAAIITPTWDPLNQCLVAGPLIALYEISIWTAKLVQKKKVETVPSPAAPTTQD